MCERVILPLTLNNSKSTSNPRPLITPDSFMLEHVQELMSGWESRSAEGLAVSPTASKNSPTTSVLDTDACVKDDTFLCPICEQRVEYDGIERYVNLVEVCGLCYTKDELEGRRCPVHNMLLDPINPDYINVQIADIQFDLAMAATTGVAETARRRLGPSHLSRMQFSSNSTPCPGRQCSGDIVDLVDTGGQPRYRVVDGRHRICHAFLRGETIVRARVDGFDSTLGYPGEGPKSAAKTSKRATCFGCKQEGHKLCDCPVTPIRSRPSSARQSITSEMIVENPRVKPMEPVAPRPQVEDRVKEMAAYAVSIASAADSIYNKILQENRAERKDPLAVSNAHINSLRVLRQRFAQRIIDGAPLVPMARIEADLSTAIRESSTRALQLAKSQATFGLDAAAVCEHQATDWVARAPTYLSEIVGWLAPVSHRAVNLYVSAKLWIPALYKFWNHYTQGQFREEGSWREIKRHLQKVALVNLLCLLASYACYRVALYVATKPQIRMAERMCPGYARKEFPVVELCEDLLASAGEAVKTGAISTIHFLMAYLRRISTRPIRPEQGPIPPKGCVQGLDDPDLAELEHMIEAVHDADAWQIIREKTIELQGMQQVEEEIQAMGREGRVPNPPIMVDGQRVWATRQEIRTHTAPADCVRVPDLPMPAQYGWDKGKRAQAPDLPNLIYRGCVDHLPPAPAPFPLDQEGLPRVLNRTVGVSEAAGNPAAHNPS